MLGIEPCRGPMVVTGIVAGLRTVVIDTVIVIMIIKAAAIYP